MAHGRSASHHDGMRWMPGKKLMDARRLLTALVFAFAAAIPALATDLSQPVMLVAAPELRDPVYGRSVLLVAPIGEDRHIGFIVNRPTASRLGQLFPEDVPSQKVTGPVFFGGPTDSNKLFAIVERPESPGGISLQLASNLFSTFDRDTVDRIIRADPEHARFFTGLVIWQSGELEQEIHRGLWYLAKPDASAVLRKPSGGLWEEMLDRSRAAAGAV